MPAVYDKSINNPAHDLRFKISEAHKTEIKRMYYQEHIHIRGIARVFPQISRRSIQFILFPERKLKVAERAKEIKRWTKYNKKELHTPAMRKHRAHKKDLIKKGLI